MKLCKLLLISLFACGCSTWKKSTLAYMGTGFATGAAIGAAQAPAGDKKAMHAALWGGITSAAIGATMVYLRDEKQELREKDLEIESLKIKLYESNKESPTIETTDFLSEDLPEDVKGLVKPGKWKLFEIDNWKKVSRGKYIHQDKLFEFKPPKINLKQKRIK